MRTTLRASIALILAAGLVTAVRAQDAETPPGEMALEEVVVTGTRLRSTEFETPNPAFSITSESIQLSGATNLTSFLTDVPALVGSLDSLQTTGSAGFIGSTGLNLLNLRNLGYERTLVLVDGRRHVAALPETAAVDVNSIPVDLVERIDVALGGVSAVYGADAVSGVVNFIMKKDFEGFTARAQWGAGDRGVPEDVHVALTGGLNFADGRGNISGAIEHTKEGRLSASDRSYLRGRNYFRLVRNPDDPSSVDDPSVPDFVALNDIRYFDSSREGGIDVDFDGVPDLRPNGAPYEIPLFIEPFLSQGGSGTLNADYIGDLKSKDQRTVASAFMHYDINDAARFFAELKFAHSKSFGYSQPTFDYYMYMTPDNPFMPAAIASSVIPGIGEAVFGDPSVPDGVLLNRDNFDLGVRAERVKRDTIRSVVGFDGDINEYLGYEVSYTYGQTRVDNLAINNRYNDRFFAALDVVVDPATGQPTCRSNLDPAALPFQPFASSGYDYSSGVLSFTPGAGSGCLPLNLFGEGVANPAAVDWVMLDSLTKSKLTQHVANAFIRGDIPQLMLPGGPVEFVLGAEWRREASHTDTPLEDQAGLTFGNVILPTRGDFNVKEGFGELRFTVFKHRPFAELLQFTGALRISDYSTVGSTTTWNTGATWAPIRDVTFRGTLSHSVRAPNIGELFSPQSQTFLFINDPCDVALQNNGSQYRIANCAALLTTLGLDPASYTDPNSSSVGGLQTGNDALSEETSRSWTLGVILRPRFATGLTVALDAYDVKIRDAISTPEAQDVANNCVDQPTLDNVFCDALTRDPSNGAIDSYVIRPENVANFRTRGVDFNIKYLLDPSSMGAKRDLGVFQFSLVGNKLTRLTFIPTPGADVIDDKNSAYAPKTQLSFDLTWLKGPVTVNYGINYFSKTFRFSRAELAGDPDMASPENIHYNRRLTHDLQFAVDVQEAVRVYAGVNNLTNQKPDLDPIYPVSPVGRFIYVGARAGFGGAR
jgi:outer membrane receptor protein involved in Fe transport